MSWHWKRRLLCLVPHRPEGKTRVAAIGNSALSYFFVESGGLIASKAQREVTSTGNVKEIMGALGPS